MCSLPVKRYLLTFYCLALLYPGEAFAQSVVAIQQERGSEIITLDPGAVSPNKVFILDKPDRLVVDVPAFASADADLPSRYHTGLISKLRTGRFNATTSRIVFDLNDKVSVEKQEKNGKLIITIIAQGQGEENKSSGPAFGFLFGNSEKPKIETPKPGKDQVETQPELSEKPEPKRKGEKTKKSKDKKSVTKNAKPVIVIDPGHGGIDPGASGISGAIEKMIVLEYAQALKTRLVKSGHYQVVLTRDHDQFIMLRKRVEIARKAQGDIFISLHADSAPGARGLSIYTVSEKASDEEAEKLAARENKADVLAGVNLTNERPDVAGILISLAERDTKNRSATLADNLVTSLDDKVHLLPDSHRFAGFAVLKAPDIPSVLIEIGFLSSPQEEKLIKSKAYRDKVVAGITAGVDSYFKKERPSE